jgi:hypothetical protein
MVGNCTYRSQQVVLVEGQTEGPTHDAVMETRSVVA